MGKKKKRNIINSRNTSNVKQPQVPLTKGSKFALLKFFGIFLAGVVLFYLLYYSDWYEKNLRDGLLSMQARLGGGIVNLFGYDASIQKEVISNGKFSMSIKNGCDGLEATAIFLSAVLAIPISFRLKLPGLLVGTVVLFFANLIRIAGLFAIGIHWNSAFEFFHLHGGLVLYMFFALVILLIWAKWAFNQEKKYANP